MLRELAQRDKNWRENVNSKIAVLAPRDITYGFARMYQVYSGESNDNYRIFRDAQEAVDWLGIPMSVLEKARADMAVDSGK